MRPATTSTLLALALPLFVAAQQQSGSASGGAPGPTHTVITATSLSTFLTFGPDRQISTGTSTIVITSTQPLTTTGPAATGSNSANATHSGNSTQSHSSTQSSVNLPTAPTNIPVGGGIAGAPSPGATGGAYGPDDGYIAAAVTLHRDTMLVGLAGLVVGGALIAL
ncbi:hypothetical protein DXG03_007048 [Asterophora parasitica]|uniref:Uncharacterized protein n=1 Tax=Asterophora parasitica TaxID=117018 RepID=A0A9P7KFY5_9AGAR|nr:hypothetical protein DXG03_007048 [Asterophora parasitica]